MIFLRWVARLTCLFLVLATGPAWAAMYDMPPPGSDVIGKVQHTTTKASDTFVKLAHKYDVGYDAMRLANPDVDPWLPGNGTPVVIPTEFILPQAPHKGIVLNIPEMRLYYFPPKGSKYAGKVFTFPVGIGRRGWATPVAKTRIIQKIPHPSWTPPASIKKEHAKNGDPLPDVVKAGPDNPLGQYALRLGLTAYLIHGTNKPAGVGMHVSHGCIRLLAPDIKSLFSMASVGTPVNIVSEPYKVGWKGNKLMMSVHPPNVDGGKPLSSYTPWVQALITATQNQPKAPVAWNRAETVVHNANGIPETIGTDPRKQDADATASADAASS